VQRSIGLIRGVSGNGWTLLIALQIPADATVLAKEVIFNRFYSTAVSLYRTLIGSHIFPIKRINATVGV